jgi:nicotinamide mononucleotide (NMN) deamidase PncC
MSAPPSIDDILPKPNDAITISLIQRRATEKGLELLKLISKKAVWGDRSINPPTVDKYLQIATSESLTCGLIMSTLVDIPWAGYAKYGGFGVYDTDAKRVFNNVKIDNVYTHKCASEMAVGVLKNSNATIAISVTGNAMPLNEHVNMLGEVFIGIACYNENGEIIFETTAMNACNTDDEDFKELTNTCSKWYKKIDDDKTRKTYNSRADTAAISKEIRYYTVLKAYEQCINFINKNNPCVPQEILDRKALNDKKNDKGIHNHIPSPRFDFGGYGICMGENEKCKSPEQGGKPYNRRSKSSFGRRRPMTGRKRSGFSRNTSITKLLQSPLLFSTRSGGKKSKKKAFKYLDPIQN